MRDVVQAGYSPTLRVGLRELRVATAVVLVVSQRQHGCIAGRYETRGRLLFAVAVFPVAAVELRVSWVTCDVARGRDHRVGGCVRGVERAGVTAGIHGRAERDHDAG